MKRLTLLVALLPVLAIAGKAEREYLKNTVTPAVEKATKAYKEACGCKLDITVDETTKNSQDVMSNVRYVAESIVDSAKGYCTDDASKKAICQMKKLVIRHDAKGETKFEFASGTGTVTLDRQSYVNWDMMAAVLDK